MTDIKFTPGPWVVEDETLYGKEFGYTVPLIDFGFYEDNERHHEDARLIAAAPELYEALGGLYNALDSGVELTPQVMMKARAALAKARGEA